MAEIIPFEPDPGNAGVGTSNCEINQAISLLGEGIWLLCLLEKIGERKNFKGWYPFFKREIKRDFEKL